jgi:hypothetical protein
MPGCNCIEQKHGGVPQSRPSEPVRGAVTRCVARQGSQPTPDHEFRTAQQSVLCVGATDELHADHPVLPR